MKVLIAVDERAFGQAISDFVQHYDWPKGTKFQIIHIVEPLKPMEKMSLSKRKLETLHEERLRSGRELVQAIGSRILEKTREAQIHEIIFEDRVAKETILNVVSDWHPDLVVVGSHSRRGLDKLMLGSVSEAVMSEAPCSVAIIRLPNAQASSTDSKSDQTEGSTVGNEALPHEEGIHEGADTEGVRQTKTAMF